MFIIASILSGVGVSAMTGSIEALVTDNLKSLDSDTKGIFEDGHAYFFAGRAIAMFFSGFLFSIDPTLPYWASSSYMVIFLLIILRIDELSFAKSTAKNNFTHFIDTFQIINQNKVLLRWLICLALVFLFADIPWFEFQPLFTSFGWDSKLIGMIFCFNAIASSFGAWFSKKFNEKLTSKQFLIYATILWGVSSILITFNSLIVVLLGILLASMAFGSTYPAFVHMVNNVIPSHQRATVISLIGFVEVSAVAIMMVPCGYINQALGITLFLRICGLILLMLAGVVVMLVPKEDSA